MMDEQQTNYGKYRGKCKQMAQEAATEDPRLVVVCGWYYDPVWNTEEEHWWCKLPDGTIVDPTRLQFPSAGMGEYREFDGFYTCAECGKQVAEADVHSVGHYVCCSYTCACRLVGV